MPVGADPIAPPYDDQTLAAFLKAIAAQPRVEPSDGLAKVRGRLNAIIEIARDIELQMEASGGPIGRTP